MAPGGFQRATQRPVFARALCHPTSSITVVEFTTAHVVVNWKESNGEQRARPPWAANEVAAKCAFKFCRDVVCEFCGKGDSNPTGLLQLAPETEFTSDQNRSEPSRTGIDMIWNTCSDRVERTTSSEVEQRASDRYWPSPI